MKKIIYLCVLGIITAGCVIGGSIYRISSFLRSREGENGGFKDRAVEQAEETERFTAVEADMEYSGLYISEGEKFSVAFEGQERYLPEWKVEDGILKIRQNGRRYHWNTGKTSLLYVTVPKESSLEYAKLDLNVGDVRISDIGIENLEMNLDVGNAILRELRLGEADLELDVGNLEAKRVSFQELKADLDVGEAQIRSLENLSEGDIRLSTELGSISFGGKQSGVHGTFENRGTGDIKLEVSCSLGEIDVDF